MTTTTTDAVRCSGLVMDFGVGAQRLRVLHGIDATFAEGELSLLVGPSGCGKTTLISIIAGVLSATGGQVEVFGRDVTAMRPAELLLYRRRTVGFIFQQFNLLPTLTAAENACVPLAAAGLSRRLAVEQASEMLNRLGMGDHLRKLPAQLSGGQQQRVAIARALVHEPQLLVCDEPTSALDAGTGHQVMEVLRELGVARNRACIVVTHDARIFDLADRIVSMEDGRVVPTQNLLETPLP
jgi:putative ABC transport system ATP-binding protein